MEITGKKSAPVPVIKSPTNYKSRIPQKIEVKIATSSTATGGFQSKIPRSTSLKYNSSVTKEPEVLVQRQVSEPLSLVETSREFEREIGKLECFTNGKNTGESITNGEIFTFAEIGYKDISNAENYGLTEEYSESISTDLDTTPKKIPVEFDSKVTNDNIESNCSSKDTSTTNETISEDTTPNKYIDQTVYQEIQQQLFTNKALTSTPTTGGIHSCVETTAHLKAAADKLEENIHSATMENDIHAKRATPETHGEPIKNGFTKLPEDFPEDDFERTEHDNDDYTTSTTTEYEKDGKVVRTTETINYTNDRNIKTRVITTEKTVTIPYGQQLDLSSPEITSSTTVRSKYLQTMLQNREFEGNNEVKAETLETIETDVQTDKVDSNDNTDDPDLDTVLVIVETLDEVRQIEPRVKAFSGNSEVDPEYVELLGVLNKSLSKFENIEPKGKKSVEEKRKNGIDYIQRLISHLNNKLQENRPTSVPEPVQPTTEPQHIVVPEKVQPRIENVTETPPSKVVEPENNTKKERKKSTLKKHFKLGGKDKKTGEEEKKKKKKLCVIS